MGCAKTANDFTERAVINFGVRKSKAPPSTGHDVPSKVEGRRVIATLYFSMGKSQKIEAFHVLVNIYLQRLYSMLFILMEAILYVLSPQPQSTIVHILVTKMAKTLDFDDF